MKQFTILAFSLIFVFSSFSQEKFSIYGDIQINGQTFEEESSIGAEKKRSQLSKLFKSYFRF